MVSARVHAPAPAPSASTDSNGHAHWVARARVAGNRPPGLETRSTPGSAISIAQRSGQPAVAFEGVLYNRVELIDALGPFASTPSDAVLISNAYARWGSEFAGHISGLFVAVIVDVAGRLALGVRDPLGAYPLFYTEADGELVLSTSIDVLREQDGVSRAVNRAALADHLCHRWPDQHETFFSSIRRVPPGYMVRWSPQQTIVSRYWDPVPPDGDVKWVREEELQDRFDSAFERAVGRTLGFGPTGLFLSGGLDSISVGAMAADLARREARPLPFAVSLAFPGEADEEIEQRGVARKLGLEHELVPFGDAVRTSLLESALAISATRPAPLLNTWLPGYADLTERAKQRGVRTILSGAGGDEWLAITPLLAADLIRSGDVKRLAQLVRGWGRSYELTPIQVVRSLFWRFGARPIASAALESIAPERWRQNRARRTSRSTFEWVAPETGVRREVDERIERWLPPARPANGFYLQDVRNSLEHTLTSMELEEIFETGRRLGVRYLHPYWDATVVDILYRTPPLLLFSGGRSKSIVRHTMARRFPGLGLERQKKRAGTSFYRSVLDREIPVVWARRNRLDALGDLGIVEPRKAAAMAESTIANRFGTGLVRIWDLMNLETWVTAHQ